MDNVEKAFKMIDTVKFRAKITEKEGILNR